MRRFVLNLLVLCFMVLVLPACENKITNKITGPSWGNPLGTLDPAVITLGAGESAVFRYNNEVMVDNLAWRVWYPSNSASLTLVIVSPLELQVLVDEVYRDARAIVTAYREDFVYGEAEIVLVR